MTLLIACGAEFIGSALIRHLVLDLGQSVVNVDKLTYAGNLETLAQLDGRDGYRFEQADIADASAMTGGRQSPVRRGADRRTRDRLAHAIR